MMINEKKRIPFISEKDDLDNFIDEIKPTPVNIQNRLKKLFLNNEETQIEVLKWLIDALNEIDFVLEEKEIIKIMEIANSKNYYLHSLAINLIFGLLSFSSPMIEMFIKNNIIDRIFLKFPFEETIDIVSNLTINSLEFKEISLKNGILKIINDTNDNKIYQYLKEKV